LADVDSPGMGRTASKAAPRQPQAETQVNQEQWAAIGMASCWRSRSP